MEPRRWISVFACLRLLSHVTLVHGERRTSIAAARLPTRGRIQSNEGGEGAIIAVEAFGGCYEWRSEQPDIIRVESSPQPSSSACLQSVSVLRCIAPWVPVSTKVKAANISYNLKYVDSLNVMF